MTPLSIHPTADISPQASIGPATRIWNYTQVREGAVIGAECVIGRDVYIDVDVQIGSRVKIQNSALIYRGVTIADGVFIGPRVCFTNDRYPRAITPEGSLKTVDDWQQGSSEVGYGASLGAGAIVVTGVTIGAFAMVAAGAVVTHDVPPYGLVMGVPARLVGYVCACGKPLQAPHNERVGREEEPCACRNGVDALETEKRTPLMAASAPAIGGSHCVATAEMVYQNDA